MEIGDSVGKICKRNHNGKEVWELVEDKINKITVTKKYGRRYFTKYVFYPLDAEEVDKNTEDMENAVGQGYIITREVFGLNEITRPFAQRWVSWANENPEKAVGVLEA